MKRLIIYIAAVLLLAGCAGQQTEGGFESVKFHTTICFGACPEYHLEVRADKSAKLYAERVFKKGGQRFGETDSAKTGYFTGTVSDTSFAKLMKTVKATVADTATWHSADCCDGSTKTVIIYYGGKRKYLKAMFPPEEANEIISVLYEIAEKSAWKRTDKQFTIEN